MSTTARFRLPLIAAGQAQKELYHNEALAAIDAAPHACIEDESVTAPPEGPAAGDSWLVAAGATGEWAERDDSLATWTEGGWRFVTPIAGMAVWNKAAGHWAHWSGTAWVSGWPVQALLIDGQQVVGSRQPDVPSPSGGTTIDAEARATIDLLIVTLKAHGLID
jgi:hypothetical protein